MKKVAKILKYSYYYYYYIIMLYSFGVSVLLTFLIHYSIFFQKIDFPDLKIFNSGFSIICKKLNGCQNFLKTVLNGTED